MQTRKIQIQHAVDVDIKDTRLAVLFDEHFTEERIKRYLDMKEREQNEEYGKRKIKESIIISKTTNTTLYQNSPLLP